MSKFNKYLEIAKGLKGGLRTLDLYSQANKEGKGSELFKGVIEEHKKRYKDLSKEELKKELEKLSYLDEKNAKIIALKELLGNRG